VPPDPLAVADPFDPPKQVGLVLLDIVTDGALGLETVTDAVAVHPEFVTVTV
jgi:hypothetical protein